jgi:hypothetical protein
MTIRTVIHTASLLALAGTLAFSQEPKPTKPPAKEPSKDSASKSSAPRKRVTSDLSGFDLLPASKQPMVVGATRSTPRATLLAPRLGRAYSITPQFEWSYSGKARQFFFVLMDDAQLEIYRADVTGMQFQYPASAPPLEPGKTYFWTVEVNLPLGGGSPPAPAGFIVVSGVQRAAIEKSLREIAVAEPFEAGLERARAFARFRVWYDAIAAYSNLISQFPNRRELYRERSEVWNQIAATATQAAKDRAQAAALQNQK